MIHFSAWVLNNSYTLGALCFLLVFVPILGMSAVHEHGWEHWEPFTKRHNVKRRRTKRTTQTVEGEDQTAEDG